MTIPMLTKALDRIEDRLNQVNELADRVLTLEQKGPGTFKDGGGTAARTIGAQAADELQKNAELLGKTKTLRLEIKAASDPLTTGNARNIISGGIGAPDGRVLGIHNGLPRRPVGGVTAVEYSRYTGQQGAAAQQATEGTAKAAVRPDHSLVMQSALTIAGYTKVSRQAINDRAELKAVIDVVLRRSIETALDAALVNGATGFTGGYEALATAYTSLVYTALVDAVSEGVSTMQTAGFSPDLVALNPADWLAITVAKGTSNDHYLSGSYLGVMPTEMRGLRVVLSPSVDAGKALVVDSGHAELLMVNDVVIEVAYDSDDFTKNLATVLGELRVIPIFRTVGAARLITPKVP